MQQRRYEENYKWGESSKMFGTKNVVMGLTWWVKDPNSHTIDSTVSPLLKKVNIN